MWRERNDWCLFLFLWPQFYQTGASSLWPHLGLIISLKALSSNVVTWGVRASVPKFTGSWNSVHDSAMGELLKEDFKLSGIWEGECFGPSYHHICWKPEAGKGGKVWKKESSLYQHFPYTVVPEWWFLIHELITEQQWSFLHPLPLLTLYTLSLESYCLTFWFAENDRVWKIVTLCYFLISGCTHLANPFQPKQATTKSWWF